MNITIHAGHAPKGKPQHGAVGVVDESERAREIVCALIKLVRDEYNEDIYDITRDDLGYSLKGLTNRANAICVEEGDLNISVHLNSFYEQSANGTEVLYYNPELRGLCSAMSAEIAKELGTKNRGAKYRTDLFFLRNTKKHAIIVEAFFCTSQSDCNLYVNNGNEKIARSILKVLENFGYITKTQNASEDIGTIYRVQVGAFKDKENAERYKKELNDKYGVSGVVKKD